MFLAPVIQHQSPKSDVAVALIARIYGKPSDNRPTTTGLYLCGLHGEHMRRVPEASGKLFEVNWKSNDVLRWMSTTGSDNSVFEEFELNLRTHKLRKLSSDKLVLSGGPLGFVDDVENSFPKGIDSADPKHPANFNRNSDGNGWTYTANGKTTAVQPDDGSPRSVSFDKPANRLWFLDWSHNSTDGTYLWIYRLDWRTGKPILLVEGSDIDFSPDRATYAAVATRGMAPYGKKRTVWVAKATVGNWQTGKSWTILDGLTYATSIALRP